MLEVALTVESGWRNFCASRDSVPQATNHFAGLIGRGLNHPARITNQGTDSAPSTRQSRIFKNFNQICGPGIPGSNGDGEQTANGHGKGQ